MFCSRRCLSGLRLVGILRVIHRRVGSAVEHRDSQRHGIGDLMRMNGFNSHFRRSCVGSSTLYPLSYFANTFRALCLVGIPQVIRQWAGSAVKRTYSLFSSKGWVRLLCPLFARSLGQIFSCWCLSGSCLHGMVWAYVGMEAQRSSVVVYV
jgi:hypothetical protein